jgi:hypothetical protein
LWNNCRNIFPRSGRKIFLQFFHNSSTIFPCRLLDKGPQNLSTIILELFHDYSLLAVYPGMETKIPQRFGGKIVEEFGACQFWGRIFLTAAN